MPPPPSDWNSVLEPEEPIPPLLADIEPADGAVIRGSEAWVRWSASGDTAAIGRVLWHKAGEADVRVSDATNEDMLRARLEPLEIGATYEYVVEQFTGDFAQRSELHTFTVEGGVAFDPPVVVETIERDYDQRVSLTLHNTTDQEIEIAAKALVHFHDLPADIVGPGSADDPQALASGESIDLRLAVFAHRATRDHYEIPVEAAGAIGMVRVTVGSPTLALEFEVVDGDPRTLEKIITVRNTGSTLSDLSVHPAPPHENEIRMDPWITNNLLPGGSMVELRAWPVLYLEFESLAIELEFTAGGQSQRLPLEFRAPRGTQLIGVRTSTVEESRVKTVNCPNSPNTCEDATGTSGMGSAATEGSAASGIAGLFPGDASQVRTALTHRSPSQKATGEAARGIESVRLASIGSAASDIMASLAQASSEGGQAGPGGDESSGSSQPVDNNGDGEQQLNEGKCKDMPCTQEQRRSYREEARRLQSEIASTKMELDALEPIAARMAERLREWGEPSPDAPLERVDKLKSQLAQLHAEYDSLKQKFEAECGEVLPDLRRYPCREIEDVPAGKRDRLPDDFSDIPCSHQHFKLGALEIADIIRGKLAYIVKKCYESCAAEDVIVAGVHCGGCILTYEVLKAQWELFEKLAMDPPSQEYNTVLRPTTPVMPQLAIETELERLGFRAFQAGQWELAYYEAWLASFERYQGASEAGKVDAMVRQAHAMRKHSQLMVDATRTQTQNLREFEKKLLPELIAGLEAVDAERGFEAALEQYRGRVGDAGLPEEQRELLHTFGVPESEIKEWGQRMLELTPEQLEANLEDLRSHVEEIEALREIQRNTLAGLDSEPIEVLYALYLQSFSNELLHRAELEQLRSEWSLAEATIPLRPGLRDALQRRAGFSREHRGPLAAPVAGDTSSSQAFTASYHTGDRVAFAWRQNDDRIVFTAFDPRGEVVMEPEMVGTGHGPRVAADEARTAVAWETGDGLVVRLHDGTSWGDEIPLPGRKAALRFAPGGPLYAATTSGLWQLDGGETLDQMHEAEYVQPALAIDNDGAPHIASVDAGQIIYEDEAVAEGERPSLAFSPDGTLHLAYLSRGSLFVRHRENGQWSEPEEIPAENPRWPALALGEGNEVRVSYIGDAGHGPPALWLVRLPDTEPILMPSLAGNVTDAWLLVHFTPMGSNRAFYRSYDALLTVNDVWIHFFENTVPDGRYLFRLNPNHVFTSSGRPATNRIGVNTWGLNWGSGQLWGDITLTVRTAWSEYYAFAANSEEVVRASEADRRLNHDRPDHALLANAMDLPVEAPLRDVDFPVTVANLGEADAPVARLVMLADGEELTSERIPVLRPDERVVINMRLSGQLDQVTFQIHYDRDEDKNKDFDLRKNRLDVRLWSRDAYEKSAQMAGVQPPPEEPEVKLVTYPNDVQPPWIAGRLPEGAKAIGEWNWHHYPSYQTVPSHSGGPDEGRSLHYFIRADEILPLASGDNLIQYVYLDPESPPRQILLQAFVEGQREGRALYWGENEDLIQVGGEPAERVGDLPEPGKWVRLKISLERFGIQNGWINGLLFGRSDGRVHWGLTTKSISRLDAETPSMVVVSEPGVTFQPDEIDRALE